MIPDLRQRARLARRRVGPRVAAALAPLAAGLVLGCDRPSPEAPQPSSVVLITIDTLRADALGAYGQTLPTSPTLDRLAAEGVLFEQCATSVPSTLPSHASIMTGKQPYAHGVRANAGYVLTAEHVTLAEILQQHGYDTAAEIAAPVIGRRTLLNQGFEHYRDLESFDVERMRLLTDGESRILHERRAADVTRRGLEFLEAHADAAFLLWLHYFDPHVRYRPPAAYAQLVPQSRYHAEVRYVDDQIARVVRALERPGLRGRTLVVVTSDHGEALGEHGEQTHSFFVYESTMRVPLIFWGPGLLSEPRRVASLVRTLDIAPTILDLLGLPPLEDVQGRSLRPLLEGRAEALDLTAYGESIEPLQMFGSSPLRFVREGSWKYIHKPHSELYELRSDPSERENLAARHPQRVARLRARLRQLLAGRGLSGSRAVVEIDPITREHLRDLGYVATAPMPDWDEKLASLAVTGPDPAMLARDFSQYGEAHAYLQQGRLERAREIFEELRQRHPASAPVLAGLVETLEGLGRTEELREVLRQAIALGSRRVDLHVRLAQLRAEDGDPAEAERLLGEALEIEPCAVTAWVILGRVLHEQRRYAEQIEALEAGALRCPDATDLRNDLAYALATCPDDALRDGPRALELARSAVEEAPSQPAYLDTLAAALAETGDFATALGYSRRATKLVETQDLPDEVVAVFREHLESFGARRPVRD